MNTLYYFDSDGNFLGGKTEDLPAPSNASGNTLIAPDFAAQKWDGEKWVGTLDLSTPADLVAFQLLYHNAPWELWSLFSLLKIYGEVEQSRKMCWYVIKMQNPAWLTAYWVTNLESWCLAYGMPIT